MIGSCSKPRVSAYNFMKYLCASLVKTKNVIINSTEIVNKIFDYKRAAPNELQFLFEDIEFRTGIGNTVSYDISEGLNNLQTFGIIGKLNHDYYLIYLTDKEADDILSDCESVVKDMIMDLIAKCF